MGILVVFVILLFVPLASAAQLAFVGDESLRELPGSGTSADPYLLRDLVINATNDTGILIKNTSAFILIKKVPYYPDTATGFCFLVVIGLVLIFLWKRK